MPPALRKADQALDSAIDELYRPAAFADDRERAEHLLGRYGSLSAPLLVAVQGKSKGRAGSSFQVGMKRSQEQYSCDLAGLSYC